MSEAIERLQGAMRRAAAGRPRVGGFPYLAETLRRAGVMRNLWYLPACESGYLTERGHVVTVGTPLAAGTLEVPPFDRAALIRALGADQDGESTLPEFLAAAWSAGVIRYEVDFKARTCSYWDVSGEEYVESYATIDIA
jgi:uncharacterized protein YbcV (DUF1398 family)